MLIIETTLLFFEISTTVEGQTHTGMYTKLVLSFAPFLSKKVRKIISRNIIEIEPFLKLSNNVYSGTLIMQLKGNWHM